MLSQLARLSVQADGRYATADELQFFRDYFKSFNLRLSAYQKIKAAEAEIIRQVLAKIKSVDPSLLLNGSEDLTSKWRLDTVRVLRHATAALLINDSERLRNNFILWFQTILRAFNADLSAEITYQVMVEVLKQYLTSEEAAVFFPIFEQNRLRK